MNPDLHRLFTLGLFEVRGLREIERLPNPPPGVEVSRVIEGGVVRRLLSLWMMFTTSAAVGNRFIHLQVKDADGNNLWEFVNGGAITASTTVRVVAVPGVPPQTGALDGVVFLRAPEFILLPSERLVTATTGLDAGDRFTSITLVWEVIPLRMPEFSPPRYGGE